MLGDGSVTYDPERQELTLNNATIAASGAEAIKSDQFLTINLKGTNTLSASGAQSVVLLNNNCLISFSLANLNINAGDAAGITVGGGYVLLISSTVLNINSNKLGIAGATGAEELTLSAVLGSVKGTSQGSICNFKNVILSGSNILSPTGAAFDASEKAVCVGGNIVKTISFTYADVYDLHIAGIRVTSENKNNVTGENITGGKISYNSETQTLTLNEAVISWAAIAIRTAIPNLNIVLVGENKVSSSTVPAMHLQNATKISGSGSLKVLSSETAIYLSPGVFLTIEDATVSAQGNNYGIRGESGATELRFIGDGTLHATGSNNGSVYGIKSLMLPKETHISTPRGATWNAATGNVELNGAVVKKEVVIEPKRYRIWIADEQLTPKNAAQILNKWNVWYEEERNTLVLDGLKMNMNSMTAEVGVHCDIDDLTIELRDKNEVTITSGTKAKTPFILGRHSRIKGFGSLDITNTTSASLLPMGILASAGFTIDSTTVNTNATYAGIFSGDLTINFANVKATGSAFASIYATSLTQNNVKITQPAGAVFDSSQKTLVDGSGNRINTEVVIEPSHLIDLWILDKQVDEAKLYTTGEGITGQVKYYPGMKKLVLEDATIDNTEGLVDNALRSEIEGLTISLDGDNKIIGYTADIMPAMVFLGNTTIEGEGTLQVVHGEGDCIELTDTYNNNNVNLTIAGATLNLESESADGIVGNSAFGRKLSLAINEAAVSIKGSETYSSPIKGIDEMNINNVSVVKPEGAYFSETLKGMTVDGTTLVKGELEIAPIKTAIENVKDNKSDAKIFAINGRIFGAENARIYDILGRDVTQMNGNLKGVFVVKFAENAQKIIVR